MIQSKHHPLNRFTCRPDWDFLLITRQSADQFYIPGVRAMECDRHGRRLSGVILGWLKALKLVT
ncbi:MAG: hypothetical protein OQK71_00575 [Desulfobacter sp.]|nr:hypothetical protein [Desulfobacter sp.]